MRKLIAGFAVSLDGYIEGPNGECDWIIYDKEQFKELAEHWKKIDAMFHGRKTYEVMSKQGSIQYSKQSIRSHEALCFFQHFNDSKR